MFLVHFKYASVPSYSQELFLYRLSFWIFSAQTPCWVHIQWQRHSCLIISVFLIIFFFSACVCCVRACVCAQTRFLFLSHVSCSDNHYSPSPCLRSRLREKEREREKYVTLSWSASLPALTLSCYWAQCQLFPTRPHLFCLLSQILWAPVHYCAMLNTMRYVQDATGFLLR